MQTATNAATPAAPAPLTVLTMFLLLYDSLSTTFMEEYGRILAEIGKWIRDGQGGSYSGRTSQGHDRRTLESPMWADICALEQRARDFTLSKGLDLDAVPQAIYDCIQASDPQGLAVIWYGDADGGPSTQVFKAQDITRYMYMPEMGIANLKAFLTYAKELVDANGVVTVDMARRWIAELEDGQLTTIAELEAAEDAKRFRALERLAHEVASKCKDGLGTVEFIERVYALIDREEGNRYGLEEDGLCACSTTNREDAMNEWYDMRNESNGRTATYHDLLEWFQRECPLTWAQWTERQLAESKA